MNGCTCALVPPPNRCQIHGYVGYPKKASHCRMDHVPTLYKFEQMLAALEHCLVLAREVETLKLAGPAGPQTGVGVMAKCYKITESIGCGHWVSNEDHEACVANLHERLELFREHVCQGCGSCGVCDARNALKAKTMTPERKAELRHDAAECLDENSAGLTEALDALDVAEAELAEARAEAERAAELRRDASRALRIGHELTLETQTLEEMATELARLVREARARVGELEGREKAYEGRHQACVAACRRSPEPCFCGCHVSVAPESAGDDT